MPSASHLGPVLVTGGTGFLGRRLVERLVANGRAVTVIGRTPAPDLEKRGVRFVPASLDDATAVRRACAGVDSIFHLAARVGVWGRFDDFFRTNVLGTRTLLAGARAHDVPRLVYTSTPSVVYNGRDLAGADESLPLTTNCPSPYPTTKAIAEREVLAANSPGLQTIALRPHLVWGIGDPHLVPRVLARARDGRLRIIGSGKNRVDLVHVENAIDAHLLAEQALGACHPLGDIPAASAPGQPGQSHPMGDMRQPAAAVAGRQSAAGRAFFITNGEPVELWAWINSLLHGLGEPPLTRRVSLGAASLVGAAGEFLWRILPLQGEPPMTRFVAAELAKDHWFDITAARRDLGYTPRVTMAAGTAELIAHLRGEKSRNETPQPARGG